MFLEPMLNAVDLWVYFDIFKFHMKNHHIDKNAKEKPISTYFHWTEGVKNLICICTYVLTIRTYKHTYRAMKKLRSKIYVLKLVQTYVRIWWIEKIDNSGYRISPKNWVQWFMCILVFLLHFFQYDDFSRKN